MSFCTRPFVFAHLNSKKYSGENPLHLRRLTGIADQVQPFSYNQLVLSIPSPRNLLLTRETVSFYADDVGADPAGNKREAQRPEDSPEGDV